MCLITCFSYSLSQGDVALKKSNSILYIATFIVIAFTILLLGPRPVDKAFTDTGYYVYSYLHIINEYEGFNFHTEWMWNNIAYTCILLGMSSKDYLMTMMILYSGLMVLACYKWMGHNLWVAVLFCFSSFSFLSYGINGICNGVACSLTMLGLAYMVEQDWKKWIAVPLFFVAFSCHRSTALPIMASLAALLIWKKPVYAIWAWLGSIAVSLVASDAITAFIVSTGFDSRMSQYANLPDEIAEEFTNYHEARQMGFRIDFLLYSAMPILMLWYTTVKRNFQDRTYNIIAITYTLANAFWVIVIRSEQSNRFAYLSWFLYPIVIAYPLLRFRMWERQDRRLAIILTLYAGFTGFMYFFYYR